MNFYNKTKFFLLKKKGGGPIIIIRNNFEHLRSNLTMNGDQTNQIKQSKPIYLR